MNPDLSEFEEPKQKGACKVRTVLQKLDEEQAEKLAAALAAPAVTTARISKVVTGWGHPIGTSSIGRHRQGGCTCD